VTIFVGQVGKFVVERKARLFSIDSHSLPFEMKGAGNDPRIYFVERLFSKIYTGSKLLAKKGWLLALDDLSPSL
jgi:hypothetical protein